jgi:hypothetical protein
MTAMYLPEGLVPADLFERRQGLVDITTLGISDSDTHVAEPDVLSSNLLASYPECQAHGMTAMYLPEGLVPADVLPGLLKRGVCLASARASLSAARALSTSPRLGSVTVTPMWPNRMYFDVNRITWTWHRVSPIGYIQ